MVKESIQKYKNRCTNMDTNKNLTKFNLTKKKRLNSQRGTRTISGRTHCEKLKQSQLICFTRNIYLMLIHHYPSKCENVLT